MTSAVAASWSAIPGSASPIASPSRVESENSRTCCLCRRIDYTWEEARLRVEVDGFGPHNSLRAHQGDRTRNNALASDDYMRLQYTYGDVTKRAARTGAQVARHYHRRRNARILGTEPGA